MLEPRSVVDAGSRILAREVRLDRILTGGQHAVAVLVTDGAESYVVRAFPHADTAVEREVRVLERITALGSIVPRFVARGLEDGHPVIVTSALPGSFPGTALPLHTIAEQMASALSRIHDLDGTGLPRARFAPPAGTTRLAVRAREEWQRVDLTRPVLTHHDYWCGNALWDTTTLVGVVDWSGARRGPRGMDVAWCRQDLVLLGSAPAADHFLREYERQAETPVIDIHAWDLFAALRADPVVETWAHNYRGIGRIELTSTVLRQRLDDWASSLVA